MKNAILFLSFLTAFGGFCLRAQVTNRVIAEHFTNTRCSTCASKNPSLKQNLRNHPDILVLSIHPSAPYPSCILHQHNPSDNDGRTNFYNIYGATPRLVIQGETAPASANFGDAGLFTTHLNQTTPFFVRIEEVRIGEDSVRAEVTVKAVSSHSENSASLFIAYVEDTLAYNAPNGEDEHWHVLRDAFTVAEGATINPPSAGDSITIVRTIPVRSEWKADQMTIIAILQDQLKLVLQSGTTDTVTTQSATNLDEARMRRYAVFPNPARQSIQIEEVQGKWAIVNMQGQLVSGGIFPSPYTVEVSVSSWPAGLYLFQTEEGNAKFQVE